jgi:hypothetical protein
MDSRGRSLVASPVRGGCVFVGEKAPNPVWASTLPPTSSSHRCMSLGKFLIHGVKYPAATMCSSSLLCRPVQNFRTGGFAGAGPSSIAAVLLEMPCPVHSRQGGHLRDDIAWPDDIAVRAGEILPCSIKPVEQDVLGSRLFCEYFSSKRGIFRVGYYVMRYSSSRLVLP